MRLNRIFWKIFITFWLVNLVVIFSASYVLVNTLETSHIQSMHRLALEQQASELIKRYEAGQDLMLHPRRRGLHPGQPGGPMPAPRFRLIDENDTLIYQRGFRGGRAEPELSVSITSDSGRVYRAESQLPRQPLFFKGMLVRLQSVQFILILFASTLASALLSWTLSRPLKKLGASSREVASGNLELQLDSKLLKRGDEIGDLARDFGQMISRVNDSLNSQKQLLHDVSHELRAPLARLQAAAALLEQKPNEQQYIEKIHHECERSNNLIQQILDYSRLNQHQEARETFELFAFLEQLVKDAAFEFPEHIIKLHSPHKELAIYGFQESLGKAFSNLLSNACKFSPSHLAINISVTEKKDHLEISICDQGPGVSQETLAKLTEPFFQCEPENSKKGFGLGLSIASRAIEKNKGKLNFYNRATRGLCAQVCLPKVTL